MGLSALQKVRKWIAEGKIAKLGGNDELTAKVTQECQAAKPAEQVTVLIGNAIEKLRELPDKSVQMCVTSPPYWGLRDYGTEPIVWGGKSDCAHEWGAEMPCHHPGQVEQTKWKDAEAAGKGQTAGSGQFCQLCGAWKGSLGLEPTPELYVQHLVEIFHEVRRVLHDSGTLWLNLGDSYWGGKGKSNLAWCQRTTERETLEQSHHNITGKGEMRPQDGKHPVIKPKDLVGIPWMAAFALRADGWYLRSDIIWAKGVSGQKEMASQVEFSLREYGIADDKVKEILADLDLYVGNCMPASVKDRVTCSHEYIFLLSKNQKYFYDNEAAKEPMVDYMVERVNREAEKEMCGQISNKLGEMRNDGGLTRTQKGAWKHLHGKRNRRSVWTIATKPYKQAHFATFPAALVEPCVLAGSSEKGCCPKCNAPWQRVIQKPDMNQRPVRADDAKMSTDEIHLSNNWAGTPKSAGQAYQEWRNANPDVTTGWKPTCSCDNVEPVPCTILDCFGGSGTTAEVALKHDRRAILIELNPKYQELIEGRIKKSQSECV